MSLFFKLFFVNHYLMIHLLIYSTVYSDFTKVIVIIYSLLEFNFFQIQPVILNY